jgi:hypothetical protein
VVADLWSWLGDVVGRIGDLSVYWLLFALALKTAESAFIGLGWRNILRAAYPRSPISFRTAWGASQGGTAAAFSITQDSVMSIWNVVLGIGVMTWAFGFATMRHMLSKRGREEARASPQA